MTIPTVLFQWGVSSFFGWGIYGLQLMLAWADRPDFRACPLLPVSENQLDIGPFETLRISHALDAGRILWRQLADHPGDSFAHVPATVLHGMGNDLEVAPSVNGMHVVSDSMVGVSFMEYTTLSGAARKRAACYRQIVTGSSWARDVLLAANIPHVTTVLQGVDTTQFHPAPRGGWMKDRFVVFSGGKIEHRKGQDLVVRAFTRFAQKHQDALLVTAWESEWMETAVFVDQMPDLPDMIMKDGKPDLRAWTLACGIPGRQVLHLPSLPNSKMPRILREADVALLPNRAEAGTNLVAMECMACGVPTILSANTGHLDLIAPDRCYALQRQTTLDTPGCEGWGESDVDEMVAALEAVYHNRAEAASRGQRAAAFMAELSWGRQMAQLAEIVRPYVI